MKRIYVVTLGDGQVLSLWAGCFDIQDGVLTFYEGQEKDSLTVAFFNWGWVKSVVPE